MTARRLLVLLLVVGLALGVAACSGADSSTAGGDTGHPSGEPTIVQSAQPDSSVVDWTEASSYVDEYVTVEGPVAGTMYAESSNGSPTFLNVGVDYPDSSRFTVVIWGEDRGGFDGAPEDTYSGQTIRVSGTVGEYEGVPQIEVSSPDDIEIVQ